MIEILEDVKKIHKLFIPLPISNKLEFHILFKMMLKQEVLCSNPYNIFSHDNFLNYKKVNGKRECSLIHH